MKNTCVTAVLTALSLSALAYADQPTTPASQKSEPQFIEYNNRMVVFNFTHQCYERTQPNALYAGVEGYCLFSVNNGHHGMFLNSQLRFGHNYFWNGRDHLTPLVGIGYAQSFWRHHHHTKHKPGVIYGLIGFNYDHEFNTVVNLGFTGKFLIGGPVSDKHQEWGSYVLGMDVSLPLTFRFGGKRQWDYRFEPFNILLSGPMLTQDYFGFRNTLGYRF